MHSIISCRYGRGVAGTCQPHIDTYFKDNVFFGDAAHLYR